MHIFSPYKSRPDLLICELSRQTGVMDKVLNANYVVNNTHAQLEEMLLQCSKTIL